MVSSLALEWVFTETGGAIYRDLGTFTEKWGMFTMFPVLSKVRGCSQSLRGTHECPQSHLRLRSDWEYLCE